MYYCGDVYEHSRTEIIARVERLETALMDALYGAADGPHLVHTLERSRLYAVLADRLNDEAKRVGVVLRANGAFIRMPAIKIDDHPNPNYNGVYTHLAWGDLDVFPVALLN